MTFRSSHSAKQRKHCNLIPYFFRKKKQLKEFKEKALEINKDLSSIANKISDDDIHIGRKL